MKKKIIALVLAIVVLVGGIIGGTFAYLADVDSDVNVMTMGNVYIEQHEYERVVENGAWVSTGETDKYGYTPDELQKFTQNKPLYPAVFQDGNIKWDDRNGSSAASGTGSHQQSWAQVGAPGSNQLFDDSVKNVQDKFVFVENTGKSDAYVRTWFAFEQGEMEYEHWKETVMTSSDVSHWDWATVASDVEIDGTEYVIWVATYKGPTSNPTGILAAKSTSYASLLQVYMTPNGTNEDCAYFGDTYEILVMSQAVQAEGFEDATTALEAAFGEATAENNPWEGLLTHGTDNSPAINAKNVLGVKVTADGGKFENLSILDNTTDFKDGGKYFRAMSGSGVTNDLTVNDSYLQGLYAFNVTAAAGSGAKLSATDTTFDGWVSYSGWASASFTDCTFIGEATHSDYAEPWVMSHCRVQTYDDTTFTNCEFGPNFAISRNNKEPITITLVNCYKDGVLVTAENFNELLNNEELNGNFRISSSNQVTVIVDGETVELFGYVADAEKLQSALADGGNASLTDDVASTTTSTGYGAADIKVNGGVLDGNGNTLSVAGSGDYSAVSTTGGTIKNLAIDDGFRGIFLENMTEDVYLDNVKLGGDGVGYTINTGVNTGEYKLVVTNSVINGWTSFSQIASASFTKCEFGQGGYFSGVDGRVLKPYVNTTVTDCSFIKGMYLDLSALADGCTVTIDGCTVDGQELNATVCTTSDVSSDYDTATFYVELPAWATSITDCVTFK